MKEAIEKAVQEDIKSMGGLIGGEAKKLTKYRNYRRRCMWRLNE